MPIGIVIEGLYAAGMHHHGPRELRVGCGYTLKREPMNQYDNNAIAVQETGITRAYLSRHSAAILSKIMDCGLPVGTVYLKPKFPAELRFRRPEQFCNIGFRVKEENVEHVKTILAEKRHRYRCLGKI